MLEAALLGVFLLGPLRDPPSRRPNKHRYSAIQAVVEPSYPRWMRRSIRTKHVASDRRPSPGASNERPGQSDRAVRLTAPVSRRELHITRADERLGLLYQGGDLQD